jgi:hypothetical protein
MSFFDRQGISEGLLRHRPARDRGCEKVDGRDGDEDHSDDDDNTTKSDGDDEFEDDILTLRNYSFISVNADAINL